jgi:hypothetical protein
VQPVEELARLFGLAPWYSAGKSIEPTPTIAACPAISRGTDMTVPIMPGLVIVTVVPAKSSTVSLFALTFLMTSS